MKTMPDSELLAALQDPDSFRKLVDTRLGNAMRREVRRTCCDGPCAYRVEAVEHYLGVLAAFAAAGEDPSRPMRGRPYDRGAGGGTAGDEGNGLLDVQCAVKALRAEHREVTAVAVAQRLCPFALDS